MLYFVILQFGAVQILRYIIIIIIIIEYWCDILVGDIGSTVAVPTDFPFLCEDSLSCALSTLIWWNFVPFKYSDILLLLLLNIDVTYL